jgi:hypothetical protein
VVILGPPVREENVRELSRDDRETRETEDSPSNGSGVFFAPVLVPLDQEEVIARRVLSVDCPGSIALDRERER